MKILNTFRLPKSRFSYRYRRRYIYIYIYTERIIRIQFLVGKPNPQPSLGNGHFSPFRDRPLFRPHTLLLSYSYLPLLHIFYYRLRREYRNIPVRAKFLFSLFLSHTPFSSFFILSHRMSSTDYNPTRVDGGGGYCQYKTYQENIESKM